MNRKLCIFTLALVFLAFSIGSVQAAINMPVTVTPNGTVPLNTTSDVTVHYDNTNGKSAVGILVVWYRPGSSGTWKPLQILLMKMMPSPYEQTVQYTFKKPGYYKFTWTVLKNVCETKTVCAKVGPVLPEPGTLAGLAISVAAVGLFFAKKRLTK
jgi:hypothetical protein